MYRNIRGRSINVSLHVYLEVKKRAEQANTTMSSIIADLLNVGDKKRRVFNLQNLQIGESLLIPWNQKIGYPVESSNLIRSVKRQASKYQMQFSWKRERDGLNVTRIA